MYVAYQVTLFVNLFLMSLYGRKENKQNLFLWLYFSLENALHFLWREIVTSEGLKLYYNPYTGWYGKTLFMCLILKINIMKPI